ncbi:Crp/Fnr family transcriptional regulator [Parapedobacter sp. ISTM3]|uniref:cAMP-binding domain of CRP or a regulatory subunit of cAMP-dependent protein kinases n=1 Tax=Parapedobacter luteus TaxID=623280 RepID=A0A1T5C4C0_9SPHI|nr:MULTISPECIES: Crp/Fnr family transcriptional regulator [Parapedobacter]MBK1439252.1 Crp/Fnr family transcriptional regulator [Parapedobacter sp. ISTM3]SKB54432.1 cAMP-binding domain of CRP or a regulatory subunit of cAMP-dependent protein kinases [Parapedobacter luteus]
MERFIEYILQFGNLNQQQIDLVSSKATVLALGKDDYYWEAGKMVRRIGFLTAGVLRVYYYTNKGEENTRYFIDENHLILDGPAFEGNYVPSEYLQAMTDCELVIFSKKNWNEISETIVDWDSIVHKITAKHHREKLERRSNLVSQDATTRYLDFIEKFPTLINRIPLSYIASYLGITQSSLSRIRKNIR